MTNTKIPALRAEDYGIESQKAREIEAVFIPMVKTFKEHEKALKANEKLQAEAKERERLQKIDDEKTRKREEKLKADLEAKENELKAKQEEEHRLKREAEEKVKAEAEVKRLEEEKARLAPDKDKLSGVLNSLQEIKLHLPSVDSGVAENILNHVFEVLDNTATYLKREIDKL